MGRHGMPQGAYLERAKKPRLRLRLPFTVPRPIRGLVKRRFRPPLTRTYGFEQLKDPETRIAFLEHLAATGIEFEFVEDHIGTGPVIRIDERDQVTVDQARASFQTAFPEPG